MPETEIDPLCVEGRLCACLREIEQAKLNSNRLSLMMTLGGNTKDGRRRLVYRPRFFGRLSARPAGWRRVPAILALVLAASVAARGAPSLTARLDREIVSLGESVTLTLTFEEASPQGNPGLPVMPNVSWTPAGQSTELTIVNGRQTSRQSFNYVLTASKPGDITIPSIQAVAGGQILATQPLRFRVVQATAPATTTALASTFIKLLVPKNDIYVGEVLPVEIQLYVQEGRDAHLPQLQSQGFTTGKFIQAPQTRTQIGNQVFNVVPFKTYVAAAKTGQLQLGPASMVLNVPRPNARRTIFGDIVDWEQVTPVAEAQVIRVSPLPAQNVPENFGGAVGSYSMSVTAGPTNLAVGDPITVKVQMAGRGLLDALTLPPQPQWRDFKIYSATSKVDAHDQLGLAGVKTFEQVIIPQNHEIKVLPALRFSFFDPEQKSYRTLSNAAVPLSVRASLSAMPPVLTNAAPSQNPAPAADDIVHIRPRLDTIGLAQVPLIHQGWFLALQGVPALAWLSLLISRKRSEALANNPRLRRQRQVAQRIREGLKQLRHLAETQQSEAFFATLFRLLQEQLGERLDLPASAITEAVIEEKLHGRNLPQETMAALHALFQTCNQARYAPQKSSQELASLIPQLEDVLRALQQLKG